MPKKPTVELLDWLVTNRSKNQELCLRLYKVIEGRKEAIGANGTLQNGTQALVAVLFSLWRAVFLADDMRNVEQFVADYESFLMRLVQHNMISYNTDQDARQWTFSYYVNNARYRLAAIAKDGLLLPKDTVVYRPESSALRLWLDTHRLADMAVARLEDITRGE